MQIKKVLFLDIDGVLNSDIFFRSLNDDEAEWKCIDENAVKLLAQIKESTDCYFVMISSWRNGWRSLRRYKMYRYAYDLLKSYGIKFNKKYSLMPNYGYGQRLNEIQDFIYEHNVERWVTLDDQFYADPGLIHINGRIGLTQENVNEAIERLNGENNGNK